MNEDKVILYKAVEITVRKSAWGNGSGFDVFFSNQPGSFEPLGDVEALRGFSTVEAGEKAGKAFVDEHQWIYVGNVDWYKVYVRQWWNGPWGYSVRGPGSMCNQPGFTSFEEARDGGIKKAEETLNALQASVEETKK